jgi:formylglycine-generating enzyme required for sulfatase activity
VIGDRNQSVGSIWEWGQDWYDREAYRNSARISPQGPPKGQSVRVMGIEGPARVIRGGGFGRSSLSRRVTERNFFPPDQGGFDLGFRVVREQPPDPPQGAQRSTRNLLH